MDPNRRIMAAPQIPWAVRNISLAPAQPWAVLTMPALALQWCEAHHPRHGRPDCLTQEQYDLLADTPENMAMGSVGPNGQKVMY